MQYCFLGEYVFSVDLGDVNKAGVDVVGFSNTKRAKHL